VVISHVIQLTLLLLISIISSTPLSLPILQEQSHEEDRRRHHGHAQEPQRGAETSRVAWQLRLEKDVGCDDAAHVTEADLERRTNGTLVMPAHLVGEPGNRDRLRHEATRGDEEGCHVADSDGDSHEVQEDGVADYTNAAPGHDEGVAMLETVGGPCDREGNNSGDDEDGDGADLGLGSSEAHLVDDSWDEEGSGVSGGVGAHVHAIGMSALLIASKILRGRKDLQGTTPDLPVSEDSLCALFVESVHSCLANIDAEFANKQRAFFVGQELCRLWPIDDPEFRESTDDRSQNALL